MIMLYIYACITILLGLRGYIDLVNSGNGINRWIILGILLGMLIWPISVIGCIILEIQKYKDNKNKC